MAVEGGREARAQRAGESGGLYRDRALELGRGNVCRTTVNARMRGAV